jgi:hypothetical protein
MFYMTLESYSNNELQNTRTLAARNVAQYQAMAKGPNSEGKRMFETASDILSQVNPGVEFI